MPNRKPLHVLVLVLFETVFVALTGLDIYVNKASFKSAEILSFFLGCSVLESGVRHHTPLFGRLILRYSCLSYMSRRVNRVVIAGKVKLL